MRPRVLLLKPGVTSSRAVLGDYEAWFERACDAEITKVETHAGELPPSGAAFDAVIMSGSPASVTQPTEWMSRAADFLLETAAQSIPVLGVCFGHQLIAWRLGAKVIRNPLGREVGTVKVDRVGDDVLLEGMPGSFDVQATHDDVVTEVPASMTVLARSALVEVQAFRSGACLWGVQFHPEMTAASTQFVLDAEQNPSRAIETPWGAHLLRRFVRLRG